MPRNQPKKPKVDRSQASDVNLEEIIGANIKRTYDQYDIFGVLVANAVKQAQQEYAQINALTLQTMQNAVETANMTAKQAVRHGDIAIDRQWNVDEQAWAVEALVQAVTRSQIFKEAVEALAVAGLANKE